MKIYPTARTKNIVIQQLGKELLLYDLANNKVYCLNETSGLVWQLSDGKKSLTDISRLMREKLKTNVSEDLIWLALEQLKRNDLLANGAEFEITAD
jgi:aminopeptidase-like protein